MTQAEELEQPSGVRRELTLADAHVHIHKCFDLAAMLRAAAGNFAEAARSLGAADAFDAVLMLTESASDAAFERLREAADAGRESGGWRFGATAEPCSLRAAHADGAGLAVLAGSQIVTEEKLEVLALGTERRFPDGAPAAEVLTAVAEAGALAVLPWGFGKWLGRRGRVLARLLEAPVAAVFLGDNGGRLRYWPQPALLADAERRGALLPGSDPLPFASEQGRAGSFGFALPGRLDPVHPATDLLRRLRDPSSRPVCYGGLTGPVDFVRNQVAMQLRKRAPAAA